MRGGSDRITGAVGINSRTGEFNVIKARATIVATNAITFRSGFVRDITGTGTLLAYRAGAALAQRRVLLRAARHAEVLFRGHHLRDPGGRALGERQGRGVHGRVRAGVGRPGRRAAHRQGDGDGKPQGQHAALSRHVADPRAPAGVFHPEQGAMDGLFLPQARRRGQDRHVRQDAVLRAQPDDQDGHPHRRRLPLRRAGAAVGGAGAGRLRQPFRRLPHRALRRQRLDRGQVRDRGSRTPAGAVARRGRSPRAARRDQCAAESRGQRGIRPHPARPAGGDVRLRHRHPETRGSVAGGVRSRHGAVRGVQEHRRAAHPRTGAAEGNRGDAARGALHPRRVALSHRVAAEPFPRGSRPARRRQLAGLGRRGRRRQRAVVQQDAGADAVLLGDAAAAEAVAACGAAQSVAGV